MSGGCFGGKQTLTDFDRVNRCMVKMELKDAVVDQFVRRGLLDQNHINRMKLETGGPKNEMITRVKKEGKHGWIPNGFWGL